MIYYVTPNLEPVARLIDEMKGRLDGLLTPLPLDDLLQTQSGPRGHYIFAGIDHLTRFETDLLADFVMALKAEAPRANVLNEPCNFVDRVPFLRKLKAEGINDYDVWQLDFGERPDRYPVFFRTADGHGGAETELLRDEDAFDAALAYYATKRIPIRNRIAVGYAAERSPDGLFRKYGVIKVGERLIAQHLLCSDEWMVKGPKRKLSPEFAREELAFIRANPHAEILDRAFALAGCDFGRVDYGIVGGRIQIYEINTNPSMPRFGKPDDGRQEKRVLIADSFIAALRAIDVPLEGDAPITFGGLRPTRHLRLFEVPTPKPLTLKRLLRRARRFVSGLFERSDG